MEGYQPKAGLESVQSRPALAHGLDKSAQGSVGAQLVGQVLGGGQDAAKFAFQHLLQKEEEARSVKALDMINAYNSELNNFRAKYEQEKQGELATDAGADFANFARELREKKLEGIGDGRLRLMFYKGTSGQAVHFEEQGLHYGNRQIEAHKKSALDGHLSDLIQLAGQNPNNQDLLDNQINAHFELVRKSHPGMDLRAHESDVRRKVLNARLAALHASGKFSDMHALLGREAAAGLPQTERTRWNNAAKNGQTAAIAASLAGSGLTPEEITLAINQMTTDPHARKTLEHACREQRELIAGFRAEQSQRKLDAVFEQAEEATRHPDFSDPERGQAMMQKLLNDAPEEIKPQVKKLLYKALGRQVEDLTNPVALEKARRDILYNGTSYNRIKSRHYHEISSFHMEDLQQMSMNKAEQKAHRLSDALFARKFTQSGLDAGLVHDYKMQFHDWLLDGAKKSSSEQADFLAKLFCRRVERSEHNQAHSRSRR
jgi:hypothetical protein